MTVTLITSASESDRAKKNNTNEIEKEDLIALEENCKLRDLPYDTCLQNELPEEANQVFSICSRRRQQANTTTYRYISNECPMAEEDIQHHINQIVNDRPQSHNESLKYKIHKGSQKGTTEFS